MDVAFFWPFYPNSGGICILFIFDEVKIVLINHEIFAIEINPPIFRLIILINCLLISADAPG